MNQEKRTETTDKKKLHFDFGTFEGFNFRDQSAMWPKVAGLAPCCFNGEQPSTRDLACVWPISSASSR